MIQIVKFDVTRDDYSIQNSARQSITVGELMNILSDYDEDAKIVFSNDNGYTYGRITENSVEEEWVDTSSA